MVTLVGEVTLLSRDNDHEERVIRLDVVKGGAVRRARVRLTAEQYEAAVQAHREERRISATGSLEKEEGSSGSTVPVVSRSSTRRQTWVVTRGFVAVDVPLEFEDDFRSSRWFA